MLKLPFPMTIALGADHAGFRLKETLADRLRAGGHTVRDFGPGGEESCDYPDFAAAAAREVASGAAERGVLICTTGVGMVIAANKVPGIRAALATTPEVVRLTREHNDVNVLTIGAKFMSAETALSLVELFLATPFDGGERHRRRIEKIAGLERAAQEEQAIP